MNYRTQGRDLNYACVAFYVLLTDLFGISTAETQGAGKEATAHFLFSGRDHVLAPNVTKSPIITETKNRSRRLTMPHARIQLKAQIV